MDTDIRNEKERREGKGTEQQGTGGDRLRHKERKPGRRRERERSI